MASMSRRDCLALLIATGGGEEVRAAASGDVDIGQILPDAVLLGLNGPSARLADFRGNPLLINFWASWCGPCRQEAKSLERLAWWDEAGTFAIIGISTDDDAAPARTLVRETGVTIRHFIDQRLQMENMLGAKRLPMTVLVDAQGRVLDKIYGSRQWDSVESRRRVAKAFWPRTQVRNTTSRHQQATKTE
jgi:thiol-disulfide isomerase/thioredoxin